MDLPLSLSKRAKEVLINGTWIANTNFKEQIMSVDWIQANKQISGLNTIALLTYHVWYYLQGLNNVFKGGSLDIKDQYSFDMPKHTSESDWQDLIQQFNCHAELFVKNIENLNDNLLSQPFVDEKYGNYLRNIEGVIEHSYYHLGQIVLIKKIVQ